MVYPRDLGKMPGQIMSAARLLVLALDTAPDVCAVLRFGVFAELPVSLFEQTSGRGLGNVP